MSDCGQIDNSTTLLEALFAILPPIKGTAVYVFYFILKRGMQQ
jgi:hypothetical protein